MKADAVFEGGGSGELLLLEQFKQWKRKMSNGKDLLGHQQEQ